NAIAEQLISLRHSHLTFSIDGATAEVFERIRVGGKFEKVCENIRRLVELRGEASEPAITVWTAVTGGKVAELRRSARLAKSLGVDELTFQLFVSDWGKSEMTSIASAARMTNGDPRLEAVLRESHAIADMIGIPLTTYRGDFLSKEKPCRWPWTSAYIASN